MRYGAERANLWDEIGEDESEQVRRSDAHENQHDALTCKILPFCFARKRQRSPIKEKIRHGKEKRRMGRNNER
jgi:hypothetical protein